MARLAPSWVMDLEPEMDPALINQIPTAAERHQLCPAHSSMENWIAIQILLPIKITAAEAGTQTCFWELEMKPLPSETLTDLFFGSWCN